MVQTPVPSRTCARVRGTAVKCKRLARSRKSQVIGSTRHCADKAAQYGTMSQIPHPRRQTLPTADNHAMVTATQCTHHWAVGSGQWALVSLLPESDERIPKPDTRVSGKTIRFSTRPRRLPVPQSVQHLCTQAPRIHQRASLCHRLLHRT